MTAFTVKWQTRGTYSKTTAGQHERLIETDQVHALFDDRTPDKRDTEPRLMLGIYTVPLSGGIVVLGNYHEGAESMALTFGDVYVMNREGKTVAKYHLSKEPLWQEDAVQGDEAPKGKAA